MDFFSEISYYLGENFLHMFGSLSVKGKGIKNGENFYGNKERKMNKKKEGIYVKK